jgi:hypothetical protein
MLGAFLTALLGAAGFGLLPASAAPLPASKTVQIVSAERFSPDEFFEITYRFATRRISVHQGDTITWRNQTTDAHTVSVVSPDQVPKTVDQVNNCAICNDIQAAHFPNGAPPQGTPVFILDNLKPANPPARFDSPGDSLIVAPAVNPFGLPNSASAQVTASPGQTLNYICAFHPWMQASIRVVGEDEDAGDR